MTPSTDSIHSITASSTNYITPLQLGVVNQSAPPPPPPVIRKAINFWNTPEPFYNDSPSPAADMRTDDFVMLRRKKGTLIDEIDILEHRPATSTESKEQKKNVTGRVGEKMNKGKKWVRFLDVGISCPSDESDDELAFCKPSWTKKNATGQ